MLNVQSQDRSVMSTKHKTRERRSTPRIPAGERVLVLPELPQTVPLMYHVMDIGPGGLSFRYLGEDRRRQDFTALSIFLDREPLLTGIPMAIVSDTLLERDHIGMRRCSVRFGTLSPSQRQRLCRYLQEAGGEKDSGGSI